MLKLFNKKKKDNKGFTLVELVIVVAILAILVGLLAPQYTKYVEKSRKSADASNLDSIVTAFKVAAADTEYNIDADEYNITMTNNDTKITQKDTPVATTNTWKDAIKEYTGYAIDENGKLGDLKLKSTKWKDSSDIVQISATIKVEPDGSVEVTYNPADVKETTK